MAITVFNTRVDKRLVGQDVFIASEPHVVPLVSPYVLNLVEVPLLLLPAKDVTIPGYTRVVALPGVNQFSVNFSTGVLTFHASAAGATIFATYWGTGSTILAIDVNEMHGPINSLETEVQTARGSQPNLDTRISFTHKADGDIKDNFIKPIHISITGTDDFTFPRDVNISGNLNVTGVVNKTASEIIDFTDDIFLMNSGFTGSPTANIGLEIERGTSPNVRWQWKESPTPSWNFTNSVGTDVLRITDSGDLTVTGTSTFSGPIQMASYTDAGETTLTSGYGAPEAGRMWFNTDSNQAKLWNGSAIVILG